MRKVLFPISGGKKVTATNNKNERLEEAALHWESLANDEPNTRPGLNRKSLYLKTAESLRIQIRTGIAVCACCHKPFGNSK